MLRLVPLEQGSECRNLALKQEMKVDKIFRTRCCWVFSCVSRGYVSNAFSIELVEDVHWESDAECLLEQIVEVLRSRVASMVLFWLMTQGRISMH